MADAADEAIPVEPAPDNHCHGNSDVIHSNGDIELKDMGTRAAEVTNNNTMVEVANNNTTINEECVNCVITDETSTDWARSRFSYNLPLSSDVGLLYSGVAEQAGETTWYLHVPATCLCSLRLCRRVVYADMATNHQHSV